MVRKLPLATSAFRQPLHWIVPFVEHSERMKALAIFRQRDGFCRTAGPACIMDAHYSYAT